jgi:cation transport ATPase
MENNRQENTAGENKQQNQDSAHHDWREERWRMRQEMREQRHRWPFHGFFMGMTLVLLGVLFLLNQTGHLTGDAWWQSLLIGLGAISILNGIMHYRHPAYRWASWGKFVCGTILILIGALLLAGVSQWWPVVLIMAGGAFLLRFFWRWQSVSS